MVAPSSRADRGQVLLIAAVTIALMLMGVAVLLNASVTTEVRAPDDPSTDIGESDRIAKDLERGLAGLVARVNAAGPYEGESAVNDTIAPNVSTFTDFFFEALGERRATLLDMSYEGVAEFGTYVADDDRTDDFTFLSGDDAHNSVRINASEPSQILGLVVSVDTSSVEDDARNATGIQLWGDTECHLYSVVSNGSETVDILNQSIECNANKSDIETDPANTTVEATCTGTFATIDLGRTAPPANNSTCYVDAFSSLEPIGDDTYGLSIRNENASLGGYHFLTDSRDFRGISDGSGDPGFYNDYDGPDTDAPYVAPIAWSVSIDVQQRARASEQSVSRDVAVYADPSSAAAMEVPWE